MLNRSSFARRDMRSASELKLTLDNLPATIEGCFHEIERIDKAEQQYLRKIATLAERRQNLMSKVQKSMQKCPPSFVDSDGHSLLKSVELSQKTNSPYLKSSPGGDSSSSKELLYRGNTQRSDMFKWDKVELQSTFCEDTVHDTLITTLKKLKWQYRDFQLIRRWCEALTNLFFEADEDRSGSIEENEFRKMIDKLPVSDVLKENLRCQFKEIKLNRSGGISLADFLFFFLQFKPFRVELNDNFCNEPYLGQDNTFCLQRTRLLIYKTITVPNFNTFSKVLYCVDLGFTLVPLVLLFIYAMSPTMENRLHWGEDIYSWFVSIFFSLQWLVGVSLCSNRAAYLSSR